MKGPKFILNRLKEDFGVSEEDEQEGFPDMNYVVGNTSGLDVGNIPTPVDRRVGDQAQIGGSTMEVQIYNPSTFSVEGDQIIDVVDQLGLDITLHSDPNMGFASAYKTRGQQGVGIETVHPYFTSYLDAMAKFKEKADREASFHIGRINPHISTSTMPALEERMPMDVGMDPFGFTVTDLEKQKYENRSEGKRNIFENSSFLEKFYRVFVVNELGNNEYQYFGNFYTSFSTKFDIEWRKAQNEVVKHIWQDRTGKNGNSATEDKVKIISLAGRQDPAISTAWLDIIEGYDFEPEPVPEQIGAVSGIDDIESLDDLDRFLKSISGQRYGLSQMARLPEIYYFMEKWQMERMASQKINEIDQEFQQKVWEKVEPVLNEAMNELWREKDDEDNVKVSLIPVQTKVGALSSELEIPQNRIPEKAFNQNEENLRDHIAKMFAGEEDYFDENGDEEAQLESLHLRFLQSFARNFEQAMWMESNLFYYIIPCWMSSSSVENDNHSGWRAPEFIWKALVEDRWSDKYSIDLKEPGVENGYFDALQESHKFRMDVCAAAAACYVWGHFTQMESSFDSGEMTWMEFMDHHGIGINLESMHGNPQQLLKLWRPKDIAVTAHAINITARDKIGDLNPELDGCIAKFTIDMEHVASFGADPWEQMEKMIENEQKIAGYQDYSLGIEESKPLAKILRQYHLMKPGVETQQGTYHGPFRRGDKQLYTWLYRLVEKGFARNPAEQAAVMYEQGEEKDETIYTTKVAMNMIELGIEPDEVTPDNVDPGKEEYRDEREALIARFFGMDKANYSKEWAKIEEHAFDPLEGLLEAEQFEYTYSSKASLENDNNPRDYAGEEYR